MYGETTPIDDATFLPLGIRRLEIPVPFIEAGGPANVYAIEDADGRWSLFDTGIGTPEGVAALRAQASEHGVDLKRLSRIVVSHGHLDHFGNAQQLSEESGARVFVHQADAAKIRGEQRYSTELVKHRAYYETQTGVPGELLEELSTRRAQSREQTRYVDAERIGLVNDGEVLHFKHFDATVKHLPGHTPGLICLHAEAKRLFFADDHVLARVSPNPVLDLSQGEGETKFRALVSYLQGATWVRNLELDAVLPGHGPAFHGHRELLDGLFGFYEKRQRRILDALEAPKSVYEVLPAIFPRRDAARLMLMISEVLANLEVMEDARRVQRVSSADGVTRYVRIEA